MGTREKESTLNCLQRAKVFIRLPEQTASFSLIRDYFTGHSRVNDTSIMFRLKWEYVVLVDAALFVFAKISLSNPGCPEVPVTCKIESTQCGYR